jgi:Autographiviridae RNA polymerase
VIHSLDAAALVLAVIKAQQLGVRQFAMVHDSYGTLAADVREMRKATREGFVELYSQDVIDNLYEQWLAQVTDPEIELPAPPEKGALDLAGVLKSDYFFA